jgi:hypothetical protein
MGDEVRKAIELIYEDIAEEVKQLRLEIATLRSTLDQSFEELCGMAKSENAKAIDMPNQRRAN